MKSKKALFVLTFIFLGLKLQSQINFRPGYIVTLEQDTLWGKVDLKSNKQLTEKCLFKSKQTGRILYQPNNIIAFGFKNGQHFESFPIDGKQRFLEMLIEGELSVYFYRDVKRRYFIKKTESKLTELNYFERTVLLNAAGYGDDGRKYNISSYDYGSSNSPKNKSGEFLIRSQDFKDTLLHKLSDAPELASEIQNIQKPEHKALIALAKNYQISKTGIEDYHVYTSKIKKSQNEFTLGWMNINYGELPSDEKFLTYSFTRYSPISNKNFYIGYGFQYTPVHLQYKISAFSIPDEFQHVFRVPVSLQYQYAYSILKPYAAIGINAYQLNDGHQAFVFGTLSYKIGLSINVYKWFNVTTNYESDYCWDRYVNNSTTANFTKNLAVGFTLTY